MGELIGWGLIALMSIPFLLLVLSVIAMIACICGLLPIPGCVYCGGYTSYCTLCGGDEGAEKRRKFYLRLIGKGQNK